MPTPAFSGVRALPLPDPLSPDLLSAVSQIGNHYSLLRGAEEAFALDV